MSEFMESAVLTMPYELAMADELSRMQFWSRAQLAYKELVQFREERSADLEAMRMAVEALEAAKFVIDVGMGMGLMRAPKDADGPVVQIPEAIAALRVRVGE